MTDDPKLLTQQLDHSLDNILNELESTSRALEKAENLIKTAGTWMDQHWGAKYDVLPSWAQKLIDESRKFEGSVANAERTGPAPAAVG